MKPQIKYSREVKEMIDKIPKLVVGLGITVLTVVPVLMVVLSFMIKKPLTISLPITLTTYTLSNSNNTAVLRCDGTSVLLKNIETGQRISFKLNNYSSLEYGVIQGTICEVNRNTGVIIVKLNKSWLTSKNKKIVPAINMNGTAEILIKKEPVFNLLLSKFTKK